MSTPKPVEKKPSMSKKRMGRLGWLTPEKTVRHLSTAEVVAWFKERAEGLGQSEAKVASCWVPAAVRSLAVVPFEGPAKKVCYQTPDAGWEGNVYEWYDLSTVPINKKVLRITVSGTVWQFRRVGEDEWRPSIFLNAASEKRAKLHKAKQCSTLDTPEST